MKATMRTAYQLLTDNGHPMLISTILCCRKELGWNFLRISSNISMQCIHKISLITGTVYCQLVRNVNKEKRLAWTEQYLNECEDRFKDVIWSDESTIQIKTHKHYCYRKNGCAPKSKPYS